MTKRKSFIALAPGRPLRASRNRKWKTETNWKQRKERKKDTKGENELKNLGETVDSRSLILTTEKT